MLVSKRFLTLFFQVLSLFMSLVYSFLGRNGMGHEILDCGRGAPFIPSPFDCHSFYRCFSTTSRAVKMSCGFLMFNPLLSTCDWPSNAIRVREECDSSFSYFSSKNRIENEMENRKKTKSRNKARSTTTKEPKRIETTTTATTVKPVLRTVIKSKTVVKEVSDRRNDTKMPRLIQTGYACTLWYDVQYRQNSKFGHRNLEQR